MDPLYLTQAVDYQKNQLGNIIHVPLMYIKNIQDKNKRKTQAIGIKIL